MKTHTISYVKKHAAALDVSEPIMVTQNGEPAYVIESYADRKRRDEAVALLKMMTLSSQDKEKGRVLTGDQVLASL
ncbi:prevent-host-death protein [Zobellella denitrificans]|jgi:hypothetical protein|uniref:Prevent-host-death protein n=1 Tax=Zobellella denitrificans TaxID=347534 RepID=A0A231MYE0_9GAMM|nr:type II toxin-antitoxin system Phd/YefM family antitoxin [Zobellella denitrificans]ATG74566.1 prevent-host-death protein [Zobellella denitrificans]OXS15178.1 prevent-host-death protein [Zobellella denitrificans]